MYESLPNWKYFIANYGFVLPFDYLIVLIPLLCIIFILRAKPAQHHSQNIYLKGLLTLIWILIFFPTWYATDLYLGYFHLSLFDCDECLAFPVAYFFSPAITLVGILNWVMSKWQSVSKRMKIMPFLIALLIYLPVAFDYHITLIAIGGVVDMSLLIYYVIFLVVEVKGFYGEIKNSRAKGE